MNKTLSDYLREHPRAESFKSTPYYEGNDLIYFFLDEPCYAEQIDNFLTIYWSNTSDKMVGLEMHGTKNLTDDPIDPVKPSSLSEGLGRLQDMGLSNRQLVEAKYIMACYAMEAILDSSVRREAETIIHLSDGESNE